MAGINYNFHDIFVKELKSLIKKYKAVITQKRGIADDNAPRNKLSTIKKKGFDHWLVDTGELRSQSFKFRAGRTTAKVYASKAKHSSKYKNPPSYEQLFRWHTKKYSGVFGIPVGSRMPIRLQREYIKQTKEHLTEWIKNENVKI